METKTFDFKKILKAVLLSLIISIVLAGILSVIVYFSDMSDRTVSMLVSAASAVSVLAGALVLAKNIERGGLLNGLAVAAGYYAVLLAVSLIVNGSVGFGAYNLLRLAVILASGMLGGVLGINSEKK
ncbi:MAG: TIGR04086 family membrane protein [Clostridiales bacterium]|nr:TIGR04086 family membrane protein [Clostridiales bacterium]